MAHNNSFHSAIVAQGRLLPGIHGLRGIAALAVVLFHIVHVADISVPEAFSFIAGDFGKGVHLFFVLSAFSLMHSTEHTLCRPTWVREYFAKRFFRIAPLFYCVLAGMVLWPIIKYQRLTVDLFSLLLNLTFTFGFAPWTGIVWAGWTVGVEMIFYAVLPVLLMSVRSSKGTLILLIASIFVAYASRSVLQDHFEHTLGIYHYNWAYFSFVPNICYFVFGMYAFRVSRDAARDAFAMRLGLSIFSAVIFLTLLFVAKPCGWNPDVILWGFVFAALSVWQSKWPSTWCANRFFEHVGERSYSVYLLHPVVIVLLKTPLQTLYNLLLPVIGAYAYFICTGLILLPLLILSEFTYRLIEIPAIRYGQRVCVRIRERTDAVIINEAFAVQMGAPHKDEPR